MSFLKKPLRKFKSGFSSSDTSNDSVSSRIVTPSSISLNDSGNVDSAIDRVSNSGTSTPNKRQSQEFILAQRQKRSLDKSRAKAENKKRESLAKIEDEKFLQEGPADLTKLYRPYSMNMSKRWNHENRINLKELDFRESEGKVITFRARIHTLRPMSAKLVFIVFRQQTMTIQGVLETTKSTREDEDSEDKGTVSEKMVRSVERYPNETIVVVRAKLRKAVQRVKNATIHDYELDVYEVHKLVNLTENVPFTVYDAENINREKEDTEDEDDSLLPAEEVSKIGTPRPFQDVVRASLDKARPVSRSRSDASRQNRSLPQRVRLNNRVVDLRTGSAQSIFRIQSGICNIFRSYLDSQGFIEIHTPKLQGGATESGATVFEVNYFGRPAFLAQSPQLSKQMCIAADFEKVYEIGAVFRAEDSNTPRHLTEYTGLDLEMALEEHYHEALDLIDDMFKNLWQGIYQRYQREIDIISQYYPHERVQWLEETPRIPFKEGVQMLKDDGWVDDSGKSVEETEDLPTRAEIRLGQLVKDKYHTDYYILDKFPASVRPFYTMPDPSDDRFTNSFDIFMRGQEILTGGQRIHDAKFLEKRMKQKGLRPDTMTEYLEGFRWGAPPHAGCGIGLERLTYLFLSLGNIRLASLFPRDPKSFPAKPPILKLRHEEASTTNPPWDRDGLETTGTGLVAPIDMKSQLQPLEKLIANYGDAANTSWLDKRYQVWRHPSTGAAQGYIVYNNYLIAIGDPLCDKRQYPQIISGFLQFLKEAYRGIKPLWMIACKDVEEYLGEKFDWRTLACIAEERANPRDNPAIKDSDLGRKVRHAEKEGVKNIELPVNKPVPEDIKAKIDEGIQRWHFNRKGSQVHLTQIRPWVDQEHRRYYYAKGPDEHMHAVVVLHQLSPKNGYQVKFSLEFPGAPSGTIESLILFSLKSIAIANPDLKQVTFGTGALPHLEGGRNLNAYKVKALKKAYATLNKQFKLTNKSEFREKMGCWNEPVFVCYPRGGLGPGGIKAIMGFLQED
ncbi:Class II aaRS and biotin synthetase [Venustampulla echinocandica]|uniref:aspartate--tRNA ligase n=1 Tax=Venustampulla echinocandica TaxID=2656787 RepID=A0A370TW72_9HELO|nr:Class II aaRS and biotin synthetase [Venustampulla echinocandica]RDL39783.1 Class II aaRS and biotin synthetase [Venustampulla echinocandica]